MKRTLTEINRELRDKLAKQGKLKEQMILVEKEVRDIYREREEFLKEAEEKFDWS